MANLMTHIVAGYPSLNESKKLVKIMVKNGVKFIEIQIPFSDPVADGKTILDANIKSLKNKINADDCLKLMKELKKEIKIPLLFMTYFNIVYKYGLEKFIKAASRAECYGLIIPDIPIDEESYENYIKLCKKYKLHAIQVISPITPIRRLKKIARVASGFVYCVSRYGITGEKDILNPDLEKYLKLVRRFIKKPLALGFGISKKAHIKAASKHADIVVIGSKIINIYNKAENNKLHEVEKFIRKVNSSLPS